MIETFAKDLYFPECPRWHDGSLWASDMWGHAVYQFGSDGSRREVHRFPDDENPGGLGWLPDGLMLVVGMIGRCIYRLEDGGAVVHADLRELAAYQLNDMIVAADGTAYVSQFGGDLDAVEAHFAPTALIRVSPDGAASVAADDLMVPNGVAITADGATLVVAEPGAARLSRYAVSDGVLSERSTIALVPAAASSIVAPDGICLDEAGAVWVADPMGRRVFRQLDGEVEQEISFDVTPLACALGGEDRRTLFVCVNEVWTKRDRRPEPTGSIVAVRVAVAGSGRP